MSDVGWVVAGFITLTVCMTVIRTWSDWLDHKRKLAQKPRLTDQPAWTYTVSPSPITWTSTTSTSPPPSEGQPNV